MGADSPAQIRPIKESPLSHACMCSFEQVLRRVPRLERSYVPTSSYASEGAELLRFARRKGPL